MDPEVKAAFDRVNKMIETLAAVASSLNECVRVHSALIDHIGQVVDRLVTSDKVVEGVLKDIN